MFEPGSVFADKYRVERKIGVGGMGVVLSATHLALDQRVAIKVLQADLVREDGVVQRFVREAKAAAKISGEHVVKVFDVGVHEREIETGHLRQRDGLLENPLAAADVDFAGRLCGEGDGGGERLGDLHAFAGERAVAREDDGMTLVIEYAAPGFEADAAEDDRFAGRLLLEETPILGNAPREFAAAADHAVFGAGRDPRLDPVPETRMVY